MSKLGKKGGFTFEEFYEEAQVTLKVMPDLILTGTAWNVLHQLGLHDTIRHGWHTRDRKQCTECARCRCERLTMVHSFSWRAGADHYLRCELGNERFPRFLLYLYICNLWAYFTRDDGWEHENIRSQSELGGSGAVDCENCTSLINLEVVAHKTFPTPLADR